MKLSLASVLLCLTWLWKTLSLYSVEPIWETSDYFRAGSYQAISTLTNNLSTPIFSFNFNPVFQAAPNIGYGVQSYRGKSHLMQATML